MEDGSRDVTFSLPYEIAVVRPLRQTSAGEREAALRAEFLERDLTALSDGDIETALWSQIERVNGRLESYERIRRIAVMKEDFAPAARSINQFEKVKIDRHAVMEHYSREIGAIYEQASAGGLA